jgi:UDP-glucose 4-epimerase
MLHAFRHAAVDPCDVFHLGNASTISVGEIADIVVEELGLSDVRYLFSGGQNGWPGDQPIAIFDVGKMSALGWEVTRSSAEVVRTAVRRLLESESYVA